MAKEKGPSLTQRIYGEILEMVIQLSDACDGVVLTEGALTERFGVSKAPVREALVQLCAEGVLRSMPRYGYAIVRMDDGDVRELKDLRCTLECTALERAFPRICPADIAALSERIRAAQAEAYESIWQVWEDNTQFHLALAALEGNRYTLRFLRETLSLQKRAYAQLHYQRQHSTRSFFDPTSHRAICDALAGGELAQALAALRQDILG